MEARGVDSVDLLRPKPPGLTCPPQSSDRLYTLSVNRALSSKMYRIVDVETIDLAEHFSLCTHEVRGGSGEVRIRFGIQQM
jgi:hypothetical protein